jgi:hypothetical protein
MISLPPVHAGSYKHGRMSAVLLLPRQLPAFNACVFSVLPTTEQSPRSKQRKHVVPSLY